VKKSRKNLIITVGVLLFVGGYFGWRAYELGSFYQDAQKSMQDVQEFWKEYESKPQSYYWEFSRACDGLLDSYRTYTDYPYSIPLEDNPVVPEIILEEEPKEITVWSEDHISVTVLSLGEGGFHITWKRNPGSWELFLGGSPEEGHVVYTKKP
jgi:hypothetical protein